jgi:transposase-like protein
MIISVYAGGMTVRDIQHHLARTLGTELSHDTISKITDEVAEEVKAWQARPLEEIYPIIYLDALVVKVRDGHHVRNKAAHIAVGVDLDGVKHVLGIWVQAVEGAKFWAGVCAELRKPCCSSARRARRVDRVPRRADRLPGGGRGHLARGHGADLICPQCSRRGGPGGHLHRPG